MYQEGQIVVYLGEEDHPEVIPAYVAKILEDGKYELMLEHRATVTATEKQIKPWTYVRR